jgi:hypothetical protein
MYQIRGLSLMGISYNLIYGGFKSTFLVTPTSTPPSHTGAPGTASGGLPSVLIGDLPVPDPDKRDTKEMRKVPIVPDSSRELAVFTGRNALPQNAPPVIKAFKFIKNHKSSRTLPRISVFSNGDCVLSKYREVQTYIRAFSVATSFSQDVPATGTQASQWSQKYKFIQKVQTFRGCFSR